MNRKPKIGSDHNLVMGILNTSNGNEPIKVYKLKEEENRKQTITDRKI